MWREFATVEREGRHWRLLVYSRPTALSYLHPIMAITADNGPEVGNIIGWVPNSVVERHGDEGIARAVEGAINTSDEHGNWAKMIGLAGQDADGVEGIRLDEGHQLALLQTAENLWVWFIHRIPVRVQSGTIIASGTSSTRAEAIEQARATFEETLTNESS